MATTIYTFDSSDPSLEVFLQAIGLDRPTFARGQISSQTLVTKGIDEAAFAFVAGKDHVLSAYEIAPLFDPESLKKPDDCVFVKTNEETILDCDGPTQSAHPLLFNPDQIKSLLRIDGCPDGISAMAILGEKLDRPLQYQNTNGVIPEAVCEPSQLLDQGFSMEDLSNIHFMSGVVSDVAINCGRTVNPVLAHSASEGDGRGSSVWVYPGIVVTAAHVVSNPQGEIVSDMEIYFDGVYHSFGPQNVVSIDQDADLAVLYFPDYFNQSDIPWAPLATDLPQNDETFLAIGYPNQATENVAQGGKAYRLYNYGTIEATLGYDVLPVNQHDPRYAAYSGYPDAQDQLIANAERMKQSGHPFLVLNSGIFYGNSGGAIFNGKGELVAVASRREFPNTRAYGTSVVLHPLEIYEVETVLDDIASLQENPDTYLDMLAAVREEVEQQFLVAISDRIERYGSGVQGIFLEDFEAAELEIAELLSFREISPHVLRMVFLQICFDSKIEIVP